MSYMKTKVASLPIYQGVHCTISGTWGFFNVPFPLKFLPNSHVHNVNTLIGSKSIYKLSHGIEYLMVDVALSMAMYQITSSTFKP